LGSLNSVGDIENVVVDNVNGALVKVRDLAIVQIGPEFRRGVLDKKGVDAVGGVVVVRYGANARQVIQALKDKINALEAGLPHGVKIVPIYDRSELIDHAVDTLRDTLIEEILLVTLAHVVFLWHFRSILIVTLPLPLSVLTSFVLMHYFGISSNIMSLGGIAIAIGVLVDGGIVITENVMRHAERYEGNPWAYQHQIREITSKATLLIGRPILISMMIIVVAFVPVFALTGVDGKLFRPLAYTKTFAMAGCILIAATLVPVLCTLLIRGRLQREDDNPAMRGIRALYRPILGLALDHRSGPAAFSNTVTSNTAALSVRSRSSKT